MSANVEQLLQKLMPDELTRESSLGLLWESLKKANSCNSNKWSIYYLSDRIRLIVGGFIVFTIYQGRVWLALDRQLLEQSPDSESLLQPPACEWDTNSYPH